MEKRLPINMKKIEKSMQVDDWDSSYVQKWTQIKFKV